jgi:hypothetical protein
MSVMRAVCSLVCLALLLMCLSLCALGARLCLCLGLCSLLGLVPGAPWRVLPLDCLVFSVCVCCYLRKDLYIRGYTPVCNLMRMFYSSNN